MAKNSVSPLPAKNPHRSASANAGVTQSESLAGGVLTGQRPPGGAWLQFERVRSILEALSFIAVIIGVPFAVIEFHRQGVETEQHAMETRRNQEKERLEAAYQIYRDVDERYMDFVKICLDHPRLDCYSAVRTDAKLSPDEDIQQRILYSALTDVFEVAYLAYQKSETNQPEIEKIRTTQWPGWEQYMRDFLSRPRYFAVWQETGSEYDIDFQKYMNGLVPIAQSRKMTASP